MSQWTYNPLARDISTQEPATQAAAEQFAFELLSHGQKADCILNGIQADPDCGFAQALGAALFLFLNTREGETRAQPYLQAAKQGRQTSFEHQFISGIEAWAQRDTRKALHIFEALQTEQPEDLLLAKISQIHLLSHGDSKAMQRIASRSLTALPNNHYAQGLAAFAAEQMDDLATAEHLGRQAVENNPEQDPWAQHAVAHILSTQGKASAGVRWLTQHKGSWQRCSSFMYTHNWWHLALFHLDLGDADAALDLYDNAIWTQRKQHIFDQVNAISLLLRIECRGHAVGNRWDDLAEHACLRSGDQVNGFNDLHVLYALARANKTEAYQVMRQNIQQQADKARDAIVWKNITEPATEAFIAHAQGRYADAAKLLLSLRPTLTELGGSTVQRAMYDEMIADQRLGIKPASAGSK